MDNFRGAEDGPVNKRFKYCSSMNSDKIDILDEPKALGLRLRKSSSLLDLIQRRLSQGNVDNGTPIQNQKKKKKYNGSVKASNFPAFLLRIGNWEYVSRLESDLVVKYYFSKRKLVWEILDGGFKSKIEISWSDILSLNVHCPETGPGSLSLVIARKPLFYKETNLEPKRHTIWKLTEDFTHGQASSHRQHFLQCSQGVINKHVEFFNFLREKSNVITDSLLFESPEGSSSSGSSSLSLSSSSSLKIDGQHEKEDEFVNEVSDLGMNQDEGMISEAEKKDEFKTILNNFTEILMNDTPTLTDHVDEKTLMSRINSFCSLLYDSFDHNSSIYSTRISN
ncbi:uncharacterized protein LOC124911947 [Impatiens glandulifera]|uniref:uncharacterized protein LOC124911947 n=1 Tax=Impatiens glandulifera TaxID=253017 RepID=UPI001FB0ED88|nr:uncharacterized protein LOC124911947 [Impatiens glandulifera]